VIRHCRPRIKCFDKYCIALINVKLKRRRIAIVQTVWNELWLINVADVHFGCVGKYKKVDY
jgi:hypothetical protein